MAALLTLNTMSKLEAGDLTKGLSPLGCSMLASVYKFNKVRCSGVDSHPSADR